MKKRFRFISLKDFLKDLQSGFKNELLKKIFIPDKNKQYIIALSGGPDSVFLAYVYKDLYKNQLIKEPVLFHFNHKIRLEADEEEEFVIQLSKNWDLPLFVESKDVKSFSKRLNKNLEESARILRYRALLRLSKQFGDCYVVTGHHGDDYIETIFLRLLRGSSLQNVNFFYKRTLPITIAHQTYSLHVLSPLLLFDKSEIMEFLDSQNISYKVDSSNFDDNFKRNYIRKHVLQPLKRIGFKSGLVWQRTHLSLIHFKQDFMHKDFFVLDKHLCNGLSQKQIKILFDQIAKTLGIMPFSSTLIAEFIHQSYTNKIFIQTKECLIESVKEKIWFIHQNAFLLKETKIFRENHLWVILWNEKKRIYDNKDVINIFYLKQTNLSKIKEILREKEIPNSIRKNVPVIVRQQSYQILLSYIEGFWDLYIPLNH